MEQPPPIELVSAPAARRLWCARLAVALTVVACVAALVYRTEVRSRYWAWQLQRTPGMAERAVYLGAICNAGERGRWGLAALLDDPRSDVRQYGVLALQHLKSPWADAWLRALLMDGDPHVRDLAAVGLALRNPKPAEALETRPFEPTEKRRRRRGCTRRRFRRPANRISCVCATAGRFGTGGMSKTASGRVHVHA